MNCKKNEFLNIVLSLCVLIIIFLIIYVLITRDNKINVASNETMEKKEEIIIKKYPNVNEILTDKQKMFIAHAGGVNATNTLEAICESYNKGYRLIELDFEWTLDDVPVVLHDWNYAIEWFYEDKLNGAVTYEEFKKLKMKFGRTQLSLNDLMLLIQEEEYKDLYVVTDVKSDNLKLINYIDDNYSHLKEKIIPQVYNREEYYKVKDLGFNDIIYTLYLSDDTMEEVIEFAKENYVFAITMDTSWAYSTLPIHLTNENVYTYAHTINDEEVFNILKNNGIKGIYTDILFE